MKKIIFSLIFLSPTVLVCFAQNKTDTLWATPIYNLYDTTIIMITDTIEKSVQQEPTIGEKEWKELITIVQGINNKVDELGKLKENNKDSIPQTPEKYQNKRTIEDYYFDNKESGIAGNYIVPVNFGSGVIYGSPLHIYCLAVGYIPSFIYPNGTACGFFQNLPTFSGCEYLSSGFLGTAGLNVRVMIGANNYCYPSLRHYGNIPGYLYSGWGYVPASMPQIHYINSGCNNYYNNATYSNAVYYNNAAYSNAVYYNNAAYSNAANYRRNYYGGCRKF